MLLKIRLKKNFSIGFCFILSCVASGIKPEIYGFDLQEDMTKRKHYFKKQPVYGTYDLVQEHKILKILLDKKLINIV